MFALYTFIPQHCKLFINALLLCTSVHRLVYWTLHMNGFIHACMFYIAFLEGCFVTVKCKAVTLCFIDFASQENNPHDKSNSALRHAASHHPVVDHFPITACPVVCDFFLQMTFKRTPHAPGPLTKSATSVPPRVHLNTQFVQSSIETIVESIVLNLNGGKALYLHTWAM